MHRRWVVLLLAVLVPVALVLGIFLGGHPSALPDIARDALVDDGEAQIFQDAIDRVADDFYRKVDRDELLDKSLAGAVDGLDRFSKYISPSEYDEFQADTEGKFAGVGVTVEEVPLGLVVRSVIPDGPAEEAGIRVGDRITAVNGEVLAELPDGTDRTQDIRGPAGSKVRLALLHDGKKREVTVTRANLSVPVSEKRMEETEDGRKVGYVTLSQFTSGAHGDVSGNIRDLLDDGAEGIIFDLRHNGGGLLQEGVLTASIFIPDGLIVSTHGRNRKTQRFNASGGAIDKDVPVVVLVDGATASASEIVTGALQDYDRATIVGTRTFGKGVFQEIEPLENGGALDITVGEYFTPDGRNLGPRGDNPGGITPEVEASDDPDTKPDEALEKGLEVIDPKL
jgi:carboxyl-terminal processing protease